ncbi:MAG: methylcobamide--CoM methyltransferase [Clostridiales Family XIII bacterium]|jgi:[methyl-Co(III) methanol-specific corrinoid protein]:coenzyme M methyltransferase|nr:methylcobamide--CoM methyltransferase [Clostridiales Family XIII bacterium]
MNDLSPKERLDRSLSKQRIDRKAIICPGGMMNAAVVDVMKQTGHILPDAHADGKLMSLLAADVSELTGFENYGLPFCMTVEPEVLGSEIDLGSLSCEPKIAREVYPNVAEVEYRDISTMLKDGRIGVISEAVSRLRDLGSEIPVIGTVSGPVSTAASIVDPMPYLKALRKDPENAHKVMDYVTDFLIAYAELLIESGADVIGIADPTATGEILGPKMFAEFAVPYLNRITDAVHKRNRKLILHICGDMGPVKQHIPALRADAISTDAMVNLKGLKAEEPDLITMGNLSTYMLEFGNPDKVSARAEVLIRDGIDIIAPACGLSTSTPIANLRAFTDTVKG